ncbi:predicted protein [Naegleria gruberi]|uniref:Predicted protein n=1 Tax=Naegleria gruberi TaxID=5762 RepID=D2VN52_NAEGR|nr:uncharacterized protein NAEGRDRAFT_70373 [Naegleria gruberi]EFC41683.1 predicted protein [Naegleria gruberi]|eukprot:XP_002674427.1 predicted protein [Naegleria gruberi strain NEG-M]
MKINVHHDTSLLSELNLGVKQEGSKKSHKKKSNEKKENQQQKESSSSLFEIVPFDEKITKESKMKLKIKEIQAKKKLERQIETMEKTIKRQQEEMEDNISDQEDVVLEEEGTMDDVEIHENVEPKFTKVSYFYKKQLNENIKEYESENPVGYFFSSPCKKSVIQEKKTKKENYTMNNPFGNHTMTKKKKEKAKDVDIIKNKMAGWGSMNSKWMEFNIEKVMPCRCVECELKRFEKHFDSSRVKVILLVDYDSWATDELSLDFKKLENIGFTTEDISKMYLWCFYNGYIYEKGMKKEDAKKVFDCYNFIIDEDEKIDEKDSETLKVITEYKNLRNTYQNTIFGKFNSLDNLQMSQTNLQPQSADLAILSTLEHLCNNLSKIENPPKICIVTRDRELSNTAKGMNQNNMIRTPFGSVNYVFKQAKKLFQ